MLFELKWSLPKNPTWLEKELEDLKRYFNTFINWKNNTGIVDEHDVILICHIEDVKRTINLIRTIFHKENFTHLSISV